MDLLPLLAGSEEHFAPGEEDTTGCGTLFGDANSPSVSMYNRNLYRKSSTHEAAAQKEVWLVNKPYTTCAPDKGVPLSSLRPLTKCQQADVVHVVSQKLDSADQQNLQRR